MGRLILLGVLGAVVVLVPATADAARTRDCGNFDGRKWTSRPLTGAGIYNVHAKNTSCKTARRVTLRAFSTAGPRVKNWRYGKWNCRVLEETMEHLEARCTRSGGRVVRWESGA